MTGGRNVFGHLVKNGIKTYGNLRKVTKKWIIWTTEIQDHFEHNIKNHEMNSNIYQ